jgi:acetyl-CoA carboxylase biotin carboxyl carrier protein
MDIEQVRQLVELMKEHELTELLVRDGDKRIVLRRGPSGQVLMGHAVPVPAMPAAPAAVPAAAPAPVAPAEDVGLVAIRSPMVGTFYAASDPQSKPFVGPGSEIGPESVVCIIEAMKVFNEIKAEMAGSIEKVMVQNAQPVEFGQPLFMVRVRK